MFCLPITVSRFLSKVYQFNNNWLQFSKFRFDTVFVNLAGCFSLVRAIITNVHE